MAQKVTTHLIDDLSGEVIEDGTGRTVQFALDGSSYEIDLTDENADNLREALSDYVAAARKVSGRSSRSGTTPPSSVTRNDPKELAKIRVWAMENNIAVAARGRISQQVRDAYDAAN